jgi:hypothetical protein
MLGNRVRIYTHLVGRLVLSLILPKGKGDRTREEGVIGLLYLNLRLLWSRGVIGILVKYVPSQLRFFVDDILESDIRSYYHFPNAYIPLFDSK